MTKPPAARRGNGVGSDGRLDVHHIGSTSRKAARSWAPPFPVVAPDAFGAHPGLAYRHYGRRDVTTFLAGHVTFGSLLAVFYPLLHPAPALHPAW